MENFFSINDITDNFAKILNVSSIIGENGAGKSLLLKLIKNSFPRGYNGINVPLIIALSNQNRITVYHFDQISIERHNLDEHKIKLKKLTPETKKVIGDDKKNEIDYTISPIIKEFSNTDFIFFSNIFDGDFEMEVEGLSDISTNYLIRNDFIKSVENKIINYEINQHQIEVHLFEEIERQIAFINRYIHDKFIPFELPEYIYLSLKREVNYDFGYSKKEKDTLEHYGIYKEFIFLLKVIKERFKSKNSKNTLVNLFIAGSLLNF